MSAIAKELIDYWCNNKGGYGIYAACKAGADRIEALERELAEAKAEAQTMKQEINEGISLLTDAAHNVAIEECAKVALAKRRGPEHLEWNGACNEIYRATVALAKEPATNG
jgi:predicted dinucleotide-utilizing enzyme